MKPQVPDMTTTINILKETHIAAAGERFDKAVETLRTWLNYDRTPFYKGFEATDATRERDAKARKLARLILTCSGSTRFRVFGGIGYGFGIEINGYTGEYGYDLCTLMEFIDYFIGHEILDDGEPGLGYYRSVRMMDEEHPGESYVLCGPDHKDAEPYFCRNIDWLRERFPDAKWLDLDDAIAAIEWHEQKRAKMADSIRKHIEKHGDKSFWDADDLAAREPNEQQRQYTSVADELSTLRGER